MGSMSEKRTLSLTTTGIRKQACFSERLTQAVLTQARLNLSKRSPDKKTTSVHHSDSNSSLLEMRITTPLPTSHDRLTYVDQPWFHSVTREQANALIKEHDSSTHNGYFLLRHSNTTPNYPLALTLWFNDGIYNVQVRKRPDNRYALGSPKIPEKSFTSIEEIVEFFSHEELPLCREGIPTGSTFLTDTPPKVIKLENTQIKR